MNRLRSLCNFSVLNLSRISQIQGTAVRRKLATKPQADERVDEGPIKYSRSRANVYKAQTTRTGISEPRLWYEQYVIMASVSIFLIYFTILREENDIDLELDRSLYSRISGLEEYQLKLSLQYNQQQGLDTADIIKRLREIEEAKNKRAETEDK